MLMEAENLFQAFGPYCLLICIFKNQIGSMVVQRLALPSHCSRDLGSILSLGYSVIHRGDLCLFGFPLSSLV